MDGNHELAARARWYRHLADRLHRMADSPDTPNGSTCLMIADQMKQLAILAEQGNTQSAWRRRWAKKLAEQTPSRHVALAAVNGHTRPSASVCSADVANLVKPRQKRRRQRGGAVDTPFSRLRTLEDDRAG